MKILCTGDVHIGRPLSRIPEWFRNGRVPSSAAWTSIVDLAIRERVDLVAISGDLVDRSNRYYEAIRPIETGAKALQAHGIPIVAVTGNHDFDVLPRVADRLDGAIRVLGGSGRWERWTLPDRYGNPRLHVDGWSFPQEHVRTNPAHAYQLYPAHDAPVLGLLHADLDNTASEYAPVNRWDLVRLHPAAWLLGHIHAPSDLRSETDKPIFYPGSPFALDPGESGIHGVVMMTIDPGGRIELERRSLAAVRYDRVEIDLTGVADPTQASTRIEDELRNALATAVETDLVICLELLVLRATLTGKVSPGLVLDPILAGFIQDFHVKAGPRNTEVMVELFENRTTSIQDLQALATGIDAPAAIARTLLALDDLESPLRREAIDGARARAKTIARSSRYRELGDPDLSDDVLARTLERESWRLLDALIAQKAASL
jgi:DNA repair exonuclease SbcCD nuclease subunit